MAGERPHTLVLTGDIGIKSAQDVTTKLRDAIGSHGDICIDTQTVSSADITTIQTLLSARATASAQGRGITMLAPLGKPLAAALGAAGFLSPEQEHLSFWSAVSDQPAGH